MLAQGQTPGKWHTKDSDVSIRTLEPTSPSIALEYVNIEAGHNL